ncbi:50S ribosomal subunit protein L17 [Candidatus Hodgkinia cicadicola]|nr:50S ribosomal subunit protein L17 [Candidatus Hodgkinia cicadicola]
MAAKLRFSACNVACWGDIYTRSLKVKPRAGSVISLAGRNNGCFGLIGLVRAKLRCGCARLLKLRVRSLLACSE